MISFNFKSGSSFEIFFRITSEHFLVNKRKNESNNEIEKQMETVLNTTKGIMISLFSWICLSSITVLQFLTSSGMTMFSNRPA